MAESHESQLKIGCVLSGCLNRVNLILLSLVVGWIPDCCCCAVAHYYINSWAVVVRSGLVWLTGPSELGPLSVFCPRITPPKIKTKIWCQLYRNMHSSVSLHSSHPLTPCYDIEGAFFLSNPLEINYIILESRQSTSRRSTSSMGCCFSQLITLSPPRIHC